MLIYIHIKFFSVGSHEKMIGYIESILHIYWWQETYKDFPKNNKAKL